MMPSQNLRDFLRVINFVLRIKVDNLPKNKKHFTSFEEELKIVPVKKIFHLRKLPTVLLKMECLKIFWTSLGGK